MQEMWKCNSRVHFKRLMKAKKGKWWTKILFHFFQTQNFYFSRPQQNTKKPKPRTLFVFKMKSKMQNQTIKYFFNQKRERESTSSIKILAFIATLKAAHWVFKALSKSVNLTVFGLKLEQLMWQAFLMNRIHRVCSNYDEMVPLLRRLRASP